MSNRRNVVLYVDANLVEKTKELGLNLSKVFGNHMKQLLMQYSAFNAANDAETIVEFGSPDVIGI